VAGARFLDLYAGSGAVGLEALSRGAAELVAVESARSSLVALERNLRIVEAQARVVRLPARRALGNLAAGRARFDLLFADPPYDLALSAAEWEGLARVAAAGAQLAYEHSATAEGPAGGSWSVVDRRRYGDSALTLLVPREGEAEGR